MTPTAHPNELGLDALALVTIALQDSASVTEQTLEVLAERTTPMEQHVVMEMLAHHTAMALRAWAEATGGDPSAWVQAQAAAYIDT